MYLVQTANFSIVVVPLNFFDGVHLKRFLARKFPTVYATRWSKTVAVYPEYTQRDERQTVGNNSRAQRK